MPISIVCSPANVHDSTKFIDTMESISEFVDNGMVQQIVTVYADKGYDAKYIRNYLRNNGINCCTTYKKNSKTILQNNIQNNGYNNYNKTRFVVERFFAWLKNGFRRTRIRYERIAENYLGLINIASFLMYCGVLR